MKFYQYGVAHQPHLTHFATFHKTKVENSIDFHMLLYWTGDKETVKEPKDIVNNLKYQIWNLSI